TSSEAIAAAVRSAIARAHEIGVASIAFPALGTGIGGFPLDEAATVTVRTVREELDEGDPIEHVIFALRGAAPYEAFGRALRADASLAAAMAGAPVAPTSGADA
ncbi:MAG: macro domain-containing protein, partial [Gaiellales bacterium]